MKSDFLFLCKKCSFQKKTLFFFVVCLNFLGAILEGLSYSLMIFAFSFFSQKPHLSIPFIPQWGFISLIFCALISQCLKSLLCLAASLINAHLGKHIQEKLELKIHEQIFRLSFSCLSRYKQGQLLSFVQSPHLCIRLFLERANLFLVDLFLILISLILMIFLSFTLTLITLSLFTLAFFMQKFLLKKSGQTSIDLSERSKEVNHKILQNLSGLKTIYLFNYQESLLKKMSVPLQKLATFSKKLFFLSAYTIAFQEVTATLVVGLTLIIGYLFFSAYNEEPLPLLLGFITIAYRLSGKVIGAMNNLNALFSLKGPLNDIRNILEEDNKEFMTKKSPVPCIFNHHISFSRVFFRYPEKNHSALVDLTFTIPKGSTVAFVGTSGSGKTTLIDLFMGLYKPTSGAILIDGFPLLDAQTYSWREKIATVNQDVTLFHDTIENNIRMGKTASLAEIITAAKLAEAHSFIEQLSEGYKTVIGNKGHRLSGGETQRIALARALLRHADIIVLDEATSHLDSYIDNLIQKKFRQYKKKITWLIVTHRLSTIKHADLIYVLDQGKISEKGNHEELLKKKGLYATLWASQLEQLASNDEHKTSDLFFYH